MTICLLECELRPLLVPNSRVSRLPDLLRAVELFNQKSLRMGEDGVMKIEATTSYDPRETFGTLYSIKFLSLCFRLDSAWTASKLRY